MPIPESRIDPHNLDRFIEAQDKVYSTVVSELKSGRKQSHWMWFIFPQIDGLGFSDIAKFYAIKNLEEAKHYLCHPVLGSRLLECSAMVLGIKDRHIEKILPCPDHLKFKSSMTLFSCVKNADPIFEVVLDRFFQGKRDIRTLDLL